jgi:NDP-sugar pyrophosphorylase family protein
MKAMIFAAGFGTRLKPITDSKPKALVKIKGKPLLEITISKLIEYGFDEIIVNVHHLAEQIISFLKSCEFNARIEISDERDKLLDTGGGLKKVKWFFDDGKPFLVHNVDIISDLNLGQMYKAHLQNKSLATLAVRNRESSRYFLFDEGKMLCGWENIKTNERIIVREQSNLTQFAFSGVQVIDPKIFEYFPEEERFSIVDVYLNAAKQEKILGYSDNSSNWTDVGRIEDLKKVNKT